VKKSESSISSGDDEWEGIKMQAEYKNEKKSRIRLGINHTQEDEEEKQLALAIQLSLHSSK